MQNTQKIYITDTSVLFELLRGHAGFFERQDKRGRNDLSELLHLFSGKYQVVVPMHAFLEIAEQFFQTRIDLDDYLRWYRERKMVFNRMLVYPLFSCEGVSLLRDIPGSYYAANRIMSPIHSLYLERLQENQNRKKAANDKKPPETQYQDKRDPKFLDGMDAAILEEAIYIAQQNPNKSCYLVSNDYPLLLAVSNLTRVYPDSSFYAPRNLKSMKMWDFPGKPKRKF